MMKNDILQSGEKLIRVLALSESKAFVIDCKKQTMPYPKQKCKKYSAVVFRMQMSCAEMRKDR